MNRGHIQSERAASENPCFSYAAGHNDGTGETIWRYVYDDEVVAFTGLSWSDLSKEEQEDVIRLFGMDNE